MTINESLDVVLNYIKNNTILQNNLINYVHGIKFFYTKTKEYTRFTVYEGNELVELTYKNNKITNINYKTYLNDSEEILLGFIDNSVHRLKIEIGRYTEEQDEIHLIINSFEEDEIFIKELELSSRVLKYFKIYVSLVEQLKNE